MLEIRNGLLLGSMGDALAAITRVASVSKTYTITHLLTIANQPLDWYLVEGQHEGEEPDTATDGEGCRDSESGDAGEEEGGEGVTGVGVEVGGARKEERCGFKTMFIRLPDMPSSNLLHHFEHCCQFIREALGQRGTILVHCEHGVSRSVTVVLAYLMWSEGRSFHVLFDDLKKRKPDIRPNPGFVEQLKLWGSMRCRIDHSNKSYRAYRLQHMAKDMIDSGYVENLHSSVDPSTNVLESATYFRCKKCRRLLFTEESVLQHELGRGQLAFKWHKRSVPTSALETSKSQFEQETSPNIDGFHTNSISNSCGESNNALCSSNDKENEIPTSVSSSLVPHQEDGKAGTDREGKVDLVQEQPDPVPVTPTELAELRAHLASVVMADSCHSSMKCSSYFTEPVEWMEELILGHVEGKILCPKCKGRLGSFSWAGEQCSCGQWVVPSFQIHRSKIDETRTLTKRKPAVSTR